MTHRHGFHHRFASHLVRASKRLLARSLVLGLTVWGLLGIAVLAEDFPVAAIPQGTRQVVMVRSEGTFRATLTGWELGNRGWIRKAGPWPAVVGRGGFAPLNAKREGDGRTPSGVFSLGMAFGRPASVRTRLAYRQATRDDHWVDDPASPSYNQWVRGTPAAKSWESMLTPGGAYDAGIVIEYNTTPVVPGAGSAIFVHIWSGKGGKGTAGCVALERKRLLRLLRWLDSRADPVIVLDPPTPDPGAHRRHESAPSAGGPAR